MRKASGLRGPLGAAVATVVGICLLMCSPVAHADTGRSDTVNPGNAKHLANPASAPDKARPARQAKSAEPAAAEAKADQSAGSDTPAPSSPAAAPLVADAAPPAPPVAPAAPPAPADAPTATPATPADAVPAQAAPAAAPDGAAEQAAPDGDATPHWTTDCNCQPEPGGRCGTYEFDGPLAVVGQHPPSILFYEPMPDVATVLAPGTKTVSTNLMITNHIIRELDSGTVVDYDFETLRLTLDYRQRLGAGEFDVRVPLDYRSHGFLDPVIADWHKTFGLHNGLRNSYPDYQYHYTLITRDGVAYNGVGDVVGIGDLALSYKYPLWDHRDGHDSAAVRAGVKVPTGNSADALGSGNWDYSLGALWQRQFTQRVRGYVNLDYVQTGAPDWPNIKQHNVFHTLWGAEYAVSPRFSLLTQYSTATNALITGSYEADKDPRELTVGFNHRIGPHVVWSGGFREDISPEASPDFGVLSNFKWEF